MRAIVSVALGAILLVATGAGARQDDAKFDEKKLIGKWEPVDVKKEARAILEFKKGGKLIITILIDGSETVVEGIWVLKETDLEVTIELVGKKESTTFKLKKLDDTVLEYVEPKGGMTIALKKMKR